MKSIEKAKLALRKHLLENKERVVADLDSMRKKSKGNDISQYFENVSNAFSFENIFPSTVVYDCSINEYEILETNSYPPPEWVENTIDKKDSEILAESFFFDIIASC